MNKQTYNNLVNGLSKRAMEVSNKKSKDYATEDVISNFKRMAILVKTLRLDMTTPFGTACFLQLLKIDRETNLINKGVPPTNESIDDTFLDELNYLYLKYGGYKETPINKTTISSDGKLFTWDNNNMTATIIGDDGDKEVLCKHGVGHSRGVHTCDSTKCCKQAIKKLDKLKK